MKNSWFLLTTLLFTPGLTLKSQSIPANKPHSPISHFFSLPESTFSPDADGFQDILTLTYETDRPGYLVNIRIFDAPGRAVRTLVHRDLLGTKGQYYWDGRDTGGQVVPPGLYILWIEYVHPDHSREAQTLLCTHTIMY